ncbi:MAG: hypothetical protein L3K16_09670 [Thermoplasmata archaeon]|nr:hypothetical protein [Thermoplasmata archaeon]
MRAKLGFLAVAAAVAVLLLAVPGSVGARAVAPFGATTASFGGLPTVGTPSVLLHYNSTGSAGYEVGQSINSTMTILNASWLEPSVNCTSKNTTVLFDGIMLTNLSAQVAGTELACRAGVATQWAFYASSTVNVTNITRISQATLPLSSGNAVRISIIHSKTTVTFLFTIGTHKFGKVLPSSGRDFVAAVGVTGYPVSTGILPLANFGTVAFGASFTKITGTNDVKVGGVNKALGSFLRVAELTLVDSKNHKLAVPTALSGSGSSFKVTWKAST